MQWLINISLFAFALQLLAFVLARRRGTLFCDALSVSAVLLTVIGALVERNLYFSRQVYVSLLMILWGARLIWHLLQRSRSAEIKTDTDNREYILARFMWSISIVAPPVLLNLAYDYGIHPGMFHQLEDMPFFMLAIFFVAFQWWSDSVKLKWHAEKIRAKDEYCIQGPWAWSRHPNYFAEVGFHACVYGLCMRHVPIFAAWGLVCTLYACIFSSGGISGLEIRRHRALGLSKSYTEYRRRISAFYPIPPRLYTTIPFAARRVLCFDLRRFNAQNNVEEEIYSSILPLSTL